jgi:hypothetical protein
MQVMMVFFDVRKLMKEIICMHVGVKHSNISMARGRNTSI